MPLVGSRFPSLPSALPLLPSALPPLPSGSSCFHSPSHPLPSQQVIATNRPYTGLARSKPPYFRPVPMPTPIERIEFDLNDPESWEALPPPESLSGAVVTFALNDAEKATTFWDAYLARVPSVVCYSSTSVYKVETPGEVISEGSAIKTLGRAVAEEYMRSHGAMVLTVSGIFGEPRSSRGICTCLSTYTSAGGVLNGRKFINMVPIAATLDLPAQLRGPWPRSAPAGAAHPH